MVWRTKRQGSKSSNVLPSPWSECSVSVELRPQGAHSLGLATSSLFGLRYFILYGTSTLFYIPSSRAQHVELTTTPKGPILPLQW